MCGAIEPEQARRAREPSIAIRNIPSRQGTRAPELGEPEHPITPSQESYFTCRATAVVRDQHPPCPYIIGP